MSVSVLPACRTVEKCKETEEQFHYNMLKTS